MYNPERQPYYSPEPSPSPDRTKEKKPMAIYAKSIANEEHPDRKEDAVFQLPEKMVFAVFDGMGGYAGGKEASTAARSLVGDIFQKMARATELGQAQKNMAEALKTANRRILREQKTHPELADMGTTASVVWLYEDDKQRRAIIGNVGDSRVYMLHGSGREGLEQVTIDDNLVTDQLKGQGIEAVKAMQKKLNNTTNLDVLDSYEKYLFGNRHGITQYLGNPKMEPRVYGREVNAGDKIIAVSDGISDNLTDQEMEGILKRARTTQEAVESLVNAAVARSRQKEHPRAKKDDMSVIIAEC